MMVDNSNNNFYNMVSKERPALSPILQNDLNYKRNATFEKIGTLNSQLDIYLKRDHQKYKENILFVKLL